MSIGYVVDDPEAAPERRVVLAAPPRMILRYRDSTRLNHWFVALMFLCAGLTGLAIFHPLFYPLVYLFGGGVWARILHPFFGVVMALGFLGLFFAVWHDNLWNRGDSAWMRASPRLLKGHEEDMPPVGKNNAGQKLVFWVAAICLIVLTITGFMFWQPW
ncbi:MAG: cytochrome b/b6 domain-containing protein, partial [Pseudomonadota bacterium]|nr:cytochrome b/b6 domain-containing protein [Pseudomonadota bacterium]